MIDIKFIRENPKLVQNGAKNKGFDIDINKVIQIDKEYRDLSTEVQKLHEERNKFARERNIEKGREIKEKLEGLEENLREKEEELKNLLSQIPALPKSDVKVGKNESENEVLRKWGEVRKLDFNPKDHLEIGEHLDIIDVEKASKVSGTRFAYLKNEAVFLEFALVQYALEALTKEGFIPIIPPVLIKQSITQGLGYWQAGGNEDYYLVYDPRCRKCETEIKINEKVCPKCKNNLEKEEHALYLVGTAEHVIVPMHKDEIFNAKDLPKRYVGFSSAFRREAGSYGKDTKGILRVHQFDKVEMVSFVKREEDDREHEYLLSLEEKLFQSLDIPYQLVKMCTGDLGFPAARKYDIEVWMPGQNKYREVTSVSTVADFQSRRLNIKYQEGNEKKYCSILNGTGFAIGRTIVAILENYQQEDGSVIIPEVLRKYVPFEKISLR
ncbi:MAG: serine--tRNA ligase [bacterium]|nr:serine--tRNA ligase [bacterium]